jgi:hypothetical protein
MRQRVTQLEELLRSFKEPSVEGASSRNHSEHPSSLRVEEAVNGFSPLDSTTKPQKDLDMNDGDADLDEINPSPGQLTLGSTETSYVSSTHWGAILNEVSLISTPKRLTFMRKARSNNLQYLQVASIKNLLNTHESPDSNNGSDSPNDLDLFFPPQHRVTQAEMLAAIPPRDVVDRLISRYFSIMDMAPRSSTK